MTNVQSGLAPPLSRPTAHRFAGREGLGGGVNTLPLVAPSVGLLLLWMIVPLAMTICFSLRRYNLLNPLIHGWAGFNNYQFLLIDPALYSALWISVVMVVAVLVITVCLGAVLAALFSTEFPGHGVARVLMISPFFVMPTVAALIWKNLLMHPVNGLFAFIARSVGLAPVDWFGRLPLSSVITIVSWEVAALRVPHSADRAAIAGPGTA